MTVYIALTIIFVTLGGALAIAWHQEYGGKDQHKHPREKNGTR